MIVVVREPAGSACSTNLRAFEEKNLFEQFGDMVLCSPEKTLQCAKSTGARFLYWRPDTEKTNGVRWEFYKEIEKELDALDVKVINPVKGLIFAQNKVACFDEWKKHDIPIPEYFVFNDKQDFYNKLQNNGIQVPYLVRLSNDNTGRDSVLVTSQDQVEKAVDTILTANNKPRFGKGIRTDMFCVKFYPTIEKQYKCHYSYRIIVAGNRVVVGYARVSPDDPKKQDNWVAITGNFDQSLGTAWIHYNRKCETFYSQNEELIVKAVKVLGLNFQGVDVIIDAKTQKPLFLEVQPGFAAGYLNHPGWSPPFYNPSQPHVVKFIQDNIITLKMKIPNYVNVWLDKNKLFRHCFSELKKSFQVN